MVINVNGQKAIQIEGKIVSSTDKAFYVDCDGDKVWLPKSAVRDDGNGLISIQEWIYKIKFPNG